MTHKQADLVYHLIFHLFTHPAIETGIFDDLKKENDSDGVTSTWLVSQAQCLRVLQLQRLHDVC